MANILERYGIKEVADVTFINIKTGVPALFLDTLKVSTIEETAEQTEARGGKGNAPLIVWDYGKEITLNITDALYSPKSMALMHSSKMANLKVYQDNTADYIRKYKNITISDGKEDHDNYRFKANEIPNLQPSGTTTLTYKTVDTDGMVGTGLTQVNFGKKAKVNKNEYSNGGMRIIGVYDPATNTLATDVVAGVTYTLVYEVLPNHRTDIEISADGFPGTYKVVGDTWARNKVTGEDQYFQFVIEQAKVSAETTITLEAEGDPSVFEMTLRVLRPDDGAMMKLIQYDFDGSDETDSITTVVGSMTYTPAEGTTPGSWGPTPSGD